MYKEILLGIVGIDVFPVVSLVLFVAVFSVAMIRVARMDRATAAHLAMLPLSEGSDLECGCFSNIGGQGQATCPGTALMQNTHIPDLTPLKETGQ